MCAVDTEEVCDVDRLPRGNAECVLLRGDATCVIGSFRSVGDLGGDGDAIGEVFCWSGKTTAAFVSAPVAQEFDHGYPGIAVSEYFTQ